MLERSITSWLVVIAGLTLCSTITSVKAPSKRRPWVAVARGLENLEFPDTVAGRRRHLEWVEGCVDWKDPGRAGDALPEGQSLQATFRRGWYFGSEAFREKLDKLLNPIMGDLSRERQKGYSGDQIRDHGEQEAKRLIKLAREVLGVADWSALAKSDWRKGLVAGLIRNRSLVPNDWVAQRLQMGARNTVSRTIRHAREHVKADKKARRLAIRLEKTVQR